MPELITQPSRVAAAGQPPKLIDEYVGRANTGQAAESEAGQDRLAVRGGVDVQVAVTPGCGQPGAVGDQAR
jgi:hypothetical protein